MKAQRLELSDRSRTVIEWFGEETSQKGLVAFLPALGANVSYYRPLAEAWARLGYRVANVELRGGSQSSVRDVRRENFGYDEILNVDLPSIVPVLRAEAAGRPVFLAGHSLGGQFALLYASRHPLEVDAVVLFAGGSNYYGALPKRCQLRRQIGLRLVRGLSQILRYFPGRKLGFGGEQPRQLMLDWTTEALTGNYGVHGDAIEYDHDYVLWQLRLPVLLLSLHGDRLVPRASADYLCSKLARAEVTQIELRATDDAPYHHFRWVRAPAAVLGAVDRWLGAQAARIARPRS